MEEKLATQIDEIKDQVQKDINLARQDVSILTQKIIDQIWGKTKAD